MIRTRQSYNEAVASEGKPSREEHCGASDLNQGDGAWLEGIGGTYPIHGYCSVGRSSKNTIVLDSQKVSRRHLIINAQNIGEFWLIDLGSSNGTYLNHHRVQQPVRLTDLDRVIVGDHVFTFRQPVEQLGEHKTAYFQQTIRQIEDVPVWLLVADIENFTPLSCSLVSEKLAVLIGGWVALCKQIVEANEGDIDKYLGDGFLAYWREDKNSLHHVAAALIALKELQVRNDLRFRLALHFGRVAMGGLPSMGEESLLGKDVNFVFRLEKLAGSLGVPLIVSGAAAKRLNSLIDCQAIGAHELKGFEGSYDLFSC